MRIELRDGQWAELRERINHGQDKLIIAARREGTPELRTIVLRQFIKAMVCRDIEDGFLDLSDADAIDRLPMDLADILYGHATELYIGATQPDYAYSALIGRMLLDGTVDGPSIERLPDPELFRDANLLAQSGTWTPGDLDATDVLLLALVRKLRNTKVTRGT